MKTIHLSADGSLLDKALKAAEAQHTTLDAAFSQWLEDFIEGAERAKAYDDLMAQLSHVEAGRKFSRDEMNERR